MMLNSGPNGVKICTELPALTNSYMYAVPMYITELQEESNIRQPHIRQQVSVLTFIYDPRFSAEGLAQAQEEGTNQGV